MYIECRQSAFGLRVAGSAAARRCACLLLHYTFRMRPFDIKCYPVKVYVYDTMTKYIFRKNI